jgi:hypothetical protein
MELVAEKQHQQFTNVFVTKDYGKFKTIDGNRMINRLHADKIAESMEEKQLVTPIIVNEKYEIIDGQHRFTGCQKKEKPVYYIICEGYGLADVHRLNEKSHDWKLKDFLDGYSVFAQKDSSYSDYVVLKEFIERNKITPAMGIFLTKGEMNDQDATIIFKNGNYKAKDLDSAELFMSRLEDFAIHFQERYKTSVFMKAFKTFSNSSKYNHENMVKKLEYTGGYLQNRSTIGQYIELLSDIYNTRLSDKKRIHFKGEKEIV